MTSVRQETIEQLNYTSKCNSRVHTIILSSSWFSLFPSRGVAFTSVIDMSDGGVVSVSKGRALGAANLPILVEL